MTIQVHLENQETIMEILREAGKKPDPILKKAVNKTVRTAKERIWKEIRRSYTLHEIPKKTLEVQRAVSGRSGAFLRVSGSPLSLVKYYKVKENSKKTAARAAVKKGPLKRIEGRGLKGFVAGVGSKKNAERLHTGIFQRKGKEHLPIRESLGPSVSKLAEVSYLLMEGELQQSLQETLWQFIDQAFQEF